MTYDRFDCRQLSEERLRVSNALAVASQQQDNARTNDIVGVLLIGVPISTLSGDNVAYQVADLKGQQRALDLSMTRKRCTGTAPVGAVAPVAFGAQPPAPKAIGAAPGAGAAATNLGVVPVGPAKGRRIRPMPVGESVARPVNYSDDEVLRYCNDAWETRVLTTGKVEYNPCFFR